jgi:hypothetical protein
MEEKSIDKCGEEETRLFEYYVYELRDPRSNETFYVGMGQGARVQSHGKYDGSTEHPKERRIAEVRDCGYPDCLRIIVGSYETAEEAFAVEATLINWVYGLENLTNINPGRHSWCIRPASQHRLKHSASDEDYPQMDGIDRPKSVRSIDGAYTQKQRQTIEQKDISSKLYFLDREFRKRKWEGSDELLNVTIIGPKLDRPQDPELILSIEGTPVNAHLKLQLTGKTVSFNLRPKGTSRSSHQRFVKHLTSDIKDPYDLTTKNGGVRGYVKAEPRGSRYCDISYDDIETILLVLKKAQLRISELRHQ